MFQPLAGVVVFTIVFRRIAGVPSDGIPYPVFSYVGLAVWAYLSAGVTRATQSLVSNSALVTKVYFPRLLAPFAAVLPGLADLVLSLLLLVVLVPIYDVDVTWAVLTLPAWILALVIVTFGVGLFLGTLNVSYRDVNQGISLLVQLWLLVSPVAYPASAVSGDWQRLVYWLNPAAGVIEGFRWALLGAPPPGPTAAVSLGVAAAVLAAAILYFERSERRFADVI